MENNEFIYYPAAQEKEFNDIVNRVKAEINAEAAIKLEETLKNLDINTQISQQVSAIQAELKKQSNKA